MVDAGTTAFETIMGDVESPSYVVTTAAHGEQAGCLVALATRCGIEPPRFAVWLSTLNRTYRVALTATALAVHLLRDSDADMARRFGGTTGDEADKFAGLDWEPGPDGCPVIRGLDWFAGPIVGRVPGGDHAGFVIAPGAGRCTRTGVRPLPPSAVSNIDAGHPIPGR
jgi:flavin reductase (DIM6/NTAB) family NADH-FMN oxidoreductase RutF